MTTDTPPITEPPDSAADHIKRLRYWWAEHAGQLTEVDESEFFSLRDIGKADIEALGVALDAATAARIAAEVRARSLTAERDVARAEVEYLRETCNGLADALDTENGVDVARPWQPSPDTSHEVATDETNKPTADLMGGRAAAGDAKEARDVD